MLNTETKRRIDTARDILVGKVPDPKTQVEQITFAMIYKFMDDMDQISVKLGGNPSFFANGYEQYAWSKLMDRKISGASRLDLYVRALDQMAQNPHIPQLFRDVFKGAFLPYRDSETLNLFLKEMNGFTYDHSEDLGDAYEYLLSIFATQGKAGQFRTPRHIIDFIVDCVNPDLNDTVLDPACGTAGFLISAYKHILEKHEENPLTPDQRQRLTANFVGYDISPDMVRLSRVNMYLHQFPNPTIFEYDTLTTEDRWEDTFDVILANPPFMTPKGGIRPHKRFAVRANRSEVLFVDYIAEHLNVDGRAGVIVPEGIIFQSSNAYKALRKMLVEENYLYAVVSLPAGIFQPYSGVKTSVLLMDKDLAKQSDSILFVKVENDGYDLGAQRNVIDKDDLPEALEIIKAFQTNPQLEPKNSKIATIVKKAMLGEDGDYNLSGERYRQIKIVSQKWPMVQLGDITLVISGQSPKGEFYNEIGVGTPFYQGKTEFTDRYLGSPTRWTTQETKIAQKGDILMSVRAPVGPVNLATERICIGRGLAAIRTDKEKANLLYVFFQLRYMEDEIKGNTGSTFSSINNIDIQNIKIPLPPIEVQQEIVGEIEGYQKVIDGARQVVENYKPVIHIDPDWPLVKLGKVCEINPSHKEIGHLPEEILVSFVPMADVNENSVNLSLTQTRRLKDVKGKYTYFAENDVLLAKVTPCFENGKAAIARNLENGIGFGSSELFVFRSSKEISPEWVYYSVKSDAFRLPGMDNMTGTGGLQRLPKYFLENYLLPIPSLAIQEENITEIQKERKIIEANKTIISRFQKRISDRIRRVWED